MGLEFSRSTILRAARLPWERWRKTAPAAAEPEAESTPAAGPAPDAQYRTALAALSTAIERLEQRVRELESRAAAAPSPRVPGGDLHLTARAAAAKLARRGQSPAQIAATLAMPRGEVALLLKVQQAQSEAARKKQPAADSTEPRVVSMKKETVRRAAKRKAAEPAPLAIQ